MTRSTPRRRLTIGKIAPWSAAAIAILTAGIGLLPLRWFGYADFQIARAAHAWDAPFVRDFRMVSDRYPGGEALEANLPSTENRRPRRFTTDSLGFRCTPVVHAGEPPAVVVLRGASFIWGGSLSDEETLPAQLARRLDLNVYNGARFLEDDETPADFDRLTASLHARPKLAVYVQLEQDAETPAWRADNGLDRFERALLGHRYNALSRSIAQAKESALTWMRLSPILSLAVRGRKAIQNDWILPNVHASNVQVCRTPGGGRMLFERAELERAATALSDDVIRNRAAVIAAWRDHLRELGIPMIAILLPDKLSVYGPALGAVVQHRAYLDRLEAQLRRSGMDVVNGLHVLRPFAAQDLRSGQFSFWRDDLHWTPLGVRRIADATVARIGKDWPAFAQTKEARHEAAAASMVVR